MVVGPCAADRAEDNFALVARVSYAASAPSTLLPLGGDTPHAIDCLWRDCG